MHPIDIRKLRTAIHATVDQIKPLKKCRTESHQPHWTWQTAMALGKAKLRATLLCSIRAEMRGRLHCKKTREEQRSFIESSLNEFKKEVATAEAA